MNYSTVEKYYADVTSHDVKWPVLTRDFFPYTANYDKKVYADYGTEYWNGFYTSHPRLKRKTRELGNLVRKPAD